MGFITSHSLQLRFILAHLQGRCSDSSNKFNDFQASPAEFLMLQSPSGEKQFTSELLVPVLVPCRSFGSTSVVTSFHQR